jgi:hypothetical protein
VPDVGVDTAGTFFLRNKAYAGDGWNFQGWRDAVSDLGAGFLMDHYFEISTGKSLAENRAATLARIDRLGAYLSGSGMDYIFNLETANWTERKEYMPGKNLFEPFPNTHFYLVPEDILSALAKMPGMKAVCFDEIEHVQLNNSRWMVVGAKGDKPALADTTHMRLPEAGEALVARMKEIREYHGKHGVATSAEFVWPVMMHLFARAGWTIAPKLMKEGWTPVPVAMALGAGIEYESAGADVWLTPDLWFCGHYPGHSVDELRSALASAHWLGASRIHVENLDYVNVRGAVHVPDAAKGFDYSTATQGKHHPDAGGWFGSLVQFSNDRDYKLTPYGEVFREYARNYNKANPVPYTWRDARCRVAIVRFEDSCWGQRKSWFADTLLGSKIEKSTPVTEAWFGIWHRLTHGVVPLAGLSFHCRDVKYKQVSRFFVPAPPTLVFDERIGDEHPDFDFRGAKMTFLTGIKVSDRTLGLLRRRVREGMIVAAMAHLAPPEIREQFEKSGQRELAVDDGKGRWIVCREFLGPVVGGALQPFLGPADEMQFQFGDHELVIRNVDNDRVSIWLDGKCRHTPPPHPSKRAVWKRDNNDNLLVEASIP